MLLVHLKNRRSLTVIEEEYYVNGLKSDHSANIISIIYSFQIGTFTGKV